MVTHSVNNGNNNNDDSKDYYSNLWIFKDFNLSHFSFKYKNKVLENKGYFLQVIEIGY